MYGEDVDRFPKKKYTVDTVQNDVCPWEHCCCPFFNQRTNSVPQEAAELFHRKRFSKVQVYACDLNKAACLKHHNLILFGCILVMQTIVLTFALIGSHEHLQRYLNYIHFTIWLLGVTLQFIFIILKRRTLNIKHWFLRLLDDGKDEGAEDAFWLTEYGMESVKWYRPESNILKEQEASSGSLFKTKYELQYTALCYSGELWGRASRFDSIYKSSSALGSSIGGLSCRRQTGKLNIFAGDLRASVSCPDRVLYIKDEGFEATLPTTISIFSDSDAAGVPRRADLKVVDAAGRQIWFRGEIGTVGKESIKWSNEEEWKLGESRETYDVRRNCSLAWEGAVDIPEDPTEKMKKLDKLSEDILEIVNAYRDGGYNFGIRNCQTYGRAILFLFDTVYQVVHGKKITFRGRYVKLMLLRFCADATVGLGIYALCTSLHFRTQFLYFGYGLQVLFSDFLRLLGYFTKYVDELALGEKEIAYRFGIFRDEKGCLCYYLGMYLVMCVWLLARILTLAIPLVIVQMRFRNSLPGPRLRILEFHKLWIPPLETIHYFLLAI